MSLNKDLLKLVRSLSGSEMRFLTLQMTSGAGRKNESGMVLLRLLREAEHSSEQEWLKFLVTEMGQVNISLLQSRLFGVILKSLRRQYDQYATTSVLAVAIQEIEILADRGLIKAAEKRIYKGKALARKREEFSLLLRLLALEQEMFFKAPRKRDIEPFFSQMAEEEAVALAASHRLQVLSGLNLHVRSRARRSPSVRNPEEREAVLTLLKHPMLEMMPPDSEFLSSFYNHHIHGLLYFSLSQYESAHNRYLAAINLWKSHPQWLEFRPEEYLTLLNNYLYACFLHQDRIRLFRQGMAELQNLGNMIPENQLKARRIAYSHQFTFLANFQSFDASREEVGKIEAWLKENEHTLQPIHFLPFSYNFVTYFFVHGEFRHALKWVREIMNYPNGPARPDIRDCARIIEIVLQFELGNFDVQEYLLRSAYRYFRRNEKLYVLEKGLLGLLRSVWKEGGFNLTEARKFLDTILEIKAQPGELNPLGTDELLLWVESKIQEVPIRVHYAGYQKGYKESD